jgi:hypothetical protein
VQICFSCSQFCVLVFGDVLHSTRIWELSDRTPETKRTLRSRVRVSALTNQNSTLEEIKRGLRLGNACYHSVQKLLFFQVKS